MLALGIACGKQQASNAPSQTSEAAPKPPEPAAPPPTSTAKSALPTAGGLSWNPPALFIAQAPKSSMRVAEYRIDGQGQGDATLAVFYFGAGQGGDVQSNIDRWVSQFQQPGAEKAKAKPTRRQVVAGMQVTTVDVEGNYSEMAMNPHATAATTAQSNQRLLGAIVEGPQGPVFFKLVGPQKTVSLADTAFAALINSIHPAL